MWQHNCISGRQAKREIDGGESITHTRIHHPIPTQKAYWETDGQIYMDMHTHHIQANTITHTQVKTQ